MEEEIIYKTGYALLSTNDYKALNEVISKAMGFPDERTETYIYAPEEPILDASGNCVMEIGADVQKNHSNIIQDIELFDKFDALNTNL